jgi:hypothetical protein
MVRDARWKYIHMANGGRQQLFDLESDPNELTNFADCRPDVVADLRKQAIAACQVPRGARRAGRRPAAQLRLPSPAGRADLPVRRLPRRDRLSRQA